MAALLPANAEQVWKDLIGAGATDIQAAAIMGNMLHEDSQLDPELVAMDSNGAYSRGLVMWNDRGAGSNVNWSQYITGNVDQDLASQVLLIKSQGGFAKASGSDPYTAGENFAHTFEACAECGYQGGSAQLPLRGQSAAMVYQVAQSGNWSVGAGTLPPLGNPGVPADGQPSAVNPTTTAFNFQLPADILNPAEIFGNVFGSVGGAISEADKGWKAVTSLISVLIAPSTWIRAGEVVLGTIIGAAGVALFAIVLAGEHPNAIMDIVGLVPGEGQAARIATGAATSAARTGRAGATISGGAQAGRRARRAPDRAPRAPTARAGGQAARGGARAATGTVRKATRETTYTPTQQAFREGRRRHDRNQRLARQWGAPAPSEDDSAADDWAEARERSSRRSNRAAYRRTMDTRDLRRRTS